MRRSRSASKGQKSDTIAQFPYGQSRIPYAPMKIFSDDQIEAIHLASLQVLRDTGMEIQSPRAVDIFRKNGADVDDDNRRVRFDPDFILEKIALAPAEFTYHARDPKHHLTVGGNAVMFATVASAPNVSDLDRGRRQGTLEDYCNMLRLGQMLNAVDVVGGYPVEPCDTDVRTRHLIAVSEAAKLYSKPLMGYAIGRERMEDAIEIARIACGFDEDTLQQKPCITTIINSNSPLVYDGNLLEGAIAMSERNQIVIYTPFTLAGAMAPITLAGALVQQNAEALVGIALSQCVRAGCPVVYGSFTSNVDMKTGSPAFGTPEYTKATIASGQLARRYKLPLRASNANASNAPDVQSAYESQMSLWACILGHVNLVNHAMGWLEGGLCASFEKMIIDAEMVQMMKSFLTLPQTELEDLAVGAIDEVGPASHFFQSPHTMERYDTAFYSPMLSDWRNFENWRDTGSIDATHRANKIWKQLLKDYQQPAMDASIRDELDAFVGKRISEGGAAPL